MKKYTVANNENGQRREFDTMEQAQEFQERMVFDFNVDCEVLES